MRKGLFIVTEGLPGTVIESQVFAQAAAARDMELAEFEVWAFAWNDILFIESEQRRERLEREYGVRVRLFRCIRPGIPGSELFNGLYLYTLLRREKVDFIRARTDYAAVISGLACLQRGIPMIWDCRGDSAAEAAGGGDEPETGLASLKKRVRKTVIATRPRLAGRLCNSALFVSRPLAEKFQPLLGGKPYAVIPCMADPRLFYYDEELRRRKRAELGIAEEELIFIYSGGLSHYQCISEMLELFNIFWQNNSCSRLIFLSPDVMRARELLLEYSFTWIVASASLPEVNGWLNASDYGFLLRRTDPLNKAASPTKFAEYAITGLGIVMTDAVPDSYALAKDAGILCHINETKINITKRNNRVVAAEYMSILLSPQAYVNEFKHVYRGALDV